MKIFRAILVSLTLGAVLLAGCSLPAVSPAGGRASLESRVKALWNARMHKDWQLVYRMADQKFKKQVSREQFLKRSHLVFSDFEVKDVRVTKPGVEGSSLVIFKTVKMGYPFRISVKETWLLEDGAWHIKMSGKKTPFSKQEW